MLVSIHKVYAGSPVTQASVCGGVVTVGGPWTVPISTTDRSTRVSLMMFGHQVANESINVFEGSVVEPLREVLKSARKLVHEGA